MKREFARKKYGTRRPPERHVLRFVLLGMVLLLSGSGIGWFVYQYHQKPERFPLLASGVQHATDWVLERQAHLSPRVEKAKHLVASVGESAAPPPIHFEFYTVLPAMQMAASSEDEVDAAQSFKTPELRSAVVVKKSQLVMPVVNATDLEREFSAQLNTPRYIVQLGVFRQSISADRYQMSYVLAGFKPKVVKTELTHREAYRVQLGPFVNRLQAELAQQKLTKKGLSGIVRSVAEG